MGGWVGEWRKRFYSKDGWLIGGWVGGWVGGRTRPSSRAISKRERTRRSLSPCHLETRSEEETEKNLQSASVATAFARKDLPFGRVGGWVGWVEEIKAV